MSLSETPRSWNSICQFVSYNKYTTRDMGVCLPSGCQIGAWRQVWGTRQVLLTRTIIFYLKREKNQTGEAEESIEREIVLGALLPIYGEVTVVDLENHGCH